jgi:pyrroline-5-carboxylate reductase
MNGSSSPRAATSHPTDLGEADEGARLLLHTRLAFIGCGIMAESILAGLLRRRLVRSDQLTASHPRVERRDELASRYGLRVFESNRDAVGAVRSLAGSTDGSIVVLCVKPQRLHGVLRELKGAVGPEQLVVSIVAGARIEKIAAELGHGLMVRAMPNTPSQIGRGMTVWTCTPQVDAGQQSQARAIFGALGREMHVETENMIDMATALSATGPTYVFLLMEALTDAGVHLGFSRHVSQELVQQTILGSVLFAMESHKHPAELRNMVTSPGGTSAEAIYQMEKGGVRTVFSKAVHAAYQRAVALGKS